MTRTDRSLGTTGCVCPRCHAALTGALVERDGCVYLETRCPEHGAFVTRVSSDAAWYEEAHRTTGPSLPPPSRQTAAARGCPWDCGICPEHEQANLLPAIEVTDVCNLDCAVCFGHNRQRSFLSADDFERCLDALEGAGSVADALVLTGGEPTTHPQLLDLVARARRRPFIARVGIATNGLLLAQRDELVAALAAANVYVLLQLDSLDPDACRALRGRDLLDVREAALAALERHDVHTSVVMTVVQGVNDGHVGEVFRYAMARPFVRGFEAQALSHTGQGGRRMAFDPARRLNGADLLHAIEAQTGGALRRGDFQPLSVVHPNCLAFTYVLRLPGGGFVPLPRIADPADYEAALRHGFAARPGPETETFLRATIDRVWSREHELPRAAEVLATLKAALADVFPRDRTLTDAERLRAAERYVTNVFLHDFLDDHTLDTAVLRRCASMLALPDGRLVPQCAWRVLHRPGTTQGHAHGLAV